MKQALGIDPVTHQPLTSAMAEPRIILWGTGAPRREFLHVDDLADACLFLLTHYDDSEIINIGWGRDQSIRELAEIIADIVGYKGTITWDTGKPDGTPRKLLDVSKLEKLGWRATIELGTGIRQVYQDYLQPIR
jgi:GDP-L-fucose synthase